MHAALSLVLVVLSIMTEAQPTTSTETPSANNTLHKTSLHRINATETGREKKMEKYLIPLLVGFKLTSLVTATFTALKIFIVQSLVVSKIALLGATLLAMKAIYDHLRYKFSHPKGIEWDTHPYHKPLWPEWYSYPNDWGAGFDSPHHASGLGTDLHSLPSEPDRTALRHIPANRTFSVRSDNEGGGQVRKPVVMGYGTVLTRITETSSDD